ALAALPPRPHGAAPLHPRAALRELMVASTKSVCHIAPSNSSRNYKWRCSMIQMFTRGTNGVGPDGARCLTFPAGEQHIVPGDDAQGPLAVLVRGAGAEDLVSAAMAIDAARRAGRPTALVLPYLPGAR